MRVLEKASRGRLESAVIQARRVAEDAARTELERLGVGEPEAPRYLSADQREQRLHLRAHGRQLGEPRDPDGRQGLDRLAGEAAYELWHRMLFARFLAENELLIHPQYKVAVSLEECRELAEQAGAESSTWEVAAGFAARMLPQIFRLDSPCLALSLAPEERKALETILAGLPGEVFQADDALGWVYQFWQTSRKDEVNASEVKIGAEELPAVTQLFTEPYMVHFLLDNSLGAWWAARRLSTEDLASAPDEATLRARSALPGLPLAYLRFVKSSGEPWRPAGGTFPGWPGSLADFRLLDPCCGSGHFLVAALHMLVPMRMALEGLPAGEACAAVLRDNLHGLEIDRRCVELAAFALAFAAWRYPGAGGYRPLPELHLACCGLAVRAAREEWSALANGRKNLRIGLDWLYDEFRDAPVLGSLINPARSDAARIQEWDTLLPVLTEALAREGSDERKEAGVTAQGLAKATVLLSGKYDLVATNVPYLARGGQNDTLREFCERRYAIAKYDLATVFLERCLEFGKQVGTIAVVLPQNWLFLPSYKKLREKLLIDEEWNFVAWIGERGFESPAAAGAFTALLILSNSVTSISSRSGADGVAHTVLSFAGNDASALRTPIEKAQFLLAGEVKPIEQVRQLRNPDARISFIEIGNDVLLSRYADSYLGLGTGDFDCFGRNFWEAQTFLAKWNYLQVSSQDCEHFGGCSYIVAWDYQEKRVRGMSAKQREQIHNQDQSGQLSWGKKGVAVALMRRLRASVYLGGPYDKSMAVLVPKLAQNLAALYSYCRSDQFNARVRQIDHNIIVGNATLAKIPFDLDYWTQVAKEKYPNGLPKPYSDDPTQWIFHGHPARSEASLQVAVARLLGYRWPAELDADMELSDEARELVKAAEGLKQYADADGLVCIPPVGGERSAADRLLDLLGAAYGADWSPARLDELLAQVDCAGKGLELWLREKFFEQHAALFHHRPFIWQVWDGQRDGFSALVNYHRLDRALLQKLIYTCLGEWIRGQEQAARAGARGAEPRLAAAQELKRKLERILEGEAPYDIFVRWKPLAEQPVGWEPDLNDGVRLNIRPFMTAEVLRHNKPSRLNVKWEKDRGKDPSTAPWYPVFKGERVNDHHLRLEEKRAARRKPHADR